MTYRKRKGAKEFDGMCVSHGQTELASMCRNVARVCTAHYGVILKSALIITLTHRTAVFYGIDIHINNES